MLGSSIAAIILCSGVVFAAPQSTEAGSEKPPVDKAALWRKDVDYLTTELAKTHKNLFHAITKEEWAESAARAKKELGDHQSTAKLAVVLMRHIARVGDSHTNLRWAQIGIPACPLKLDSFADGVFVFGNGTQEPRLTGARVDAIEGIGIEKLITSLAPLIPHENDVHLRSTALQLILVPGILHEAGITKAEDRLVLQCRDRQGKEFTTESRALPHLRLQATRYRYAFDTVPMCLEKGREAFWFKYLPDRKALYLKYNSCRDGPGFAKLVDEMWKSVENATPQKSVEKLIIDVRHNGGGNSLIIQPLIASILARRDLRKNGLFVIIGRRTFSSALLNATMLRDNLKATLVGEATAGKPNHFGEIKPLKLPESRLTVFYSTKYFKKVKGDPPSLEPDRKVEIRAAEFFAGKDPFLEAIFTDSGR